MIFEVVVLTLGRDVAALEGGRRMNSVGGYGRDKELGVGVLLFRMGLVSVTMFIVRELLIVGPLLMVWNMAAAVRTLGMVVTCIVSVRIRDYLSAELG